LMDLLDEALFSIKVSGMAILNVHDFSCLKEIDFRIAPVTVLIGPQGSGKSVTTKLTYFFLDQLSRQYQCAEKGVSLEDFKKEAARQFRTWFPPAAWGSGRFNITFSAGAYSARALRRMSGGKVTEDVAITFSDYFNAQYKELCSVYKEPNIIDEESPGAIRSAFERTWRVRDAFESRWSKVLGSEYLASQTFIPAGRAFFTSIGRLVAAFDQGSSIDPLTLRFAKIFATLRDRRSNLIFGTPEEPEDILRRKQVMRQLFGGEIKFENELEFVETRDGRRVPFSALSSGQQELLPMWLMFEQLARFAKGRGELVYIEEPEAHLFPSAQNLLMEYLIGSIVSKRNNRRLVLTTHSPYLLSKLNNFLKAGALGRRKELATSVAKVVDKSCWLTPSRVSAYALDNGRLVPLIRDGMIDGAYIDEVSESVARQFSSLLDIEYPDV
jgi:hypothetical protein